ncbi:hypothetical protein ZIOFF_051103 [Zingiber officinale]|uniref:65-kDa microtubule-associated protein 3 n=1 Tax=Zingiber officinale TaxID=94328 RepID=A0A8J5FLC3_ZINOF|nr:hypothetical protein ZIOFF_051103 [Zingiber officinale]
MALDPNCRPTRIATAHRTLLDELQIIWDEVGESEDEKDKMMLELEQECRNLYRRKIDEADQYRDRIRQAIAGLQAEIEDICCSMGEPPVHGIESAGSLKEQLNAVTLKLEEMQIEKNARLLKFLEVMDQIRKILAEFSPIECDDSKFSVDESDLSTRALRELEKQLQSLQEEKSERLRRVMEHSNTLKAFCAVLGLSYEETTRDLHHNSHHDEGYMSISDDSVESLVSAIEHLRKVKLERMQKLQDLASAMLELWNLMDVPSEEQQQFQSVACNIAASEQEFTELNSLSLEFIDHVRAEVLRLEQLKASRIEELILKKKTELHEIHLKTHLIAESQEPDLDIDDVQAGAIDASSMLEQLEVQISAAKEEAFSRKDVLERVEKWLAVCEEENWLEEYNRDGNRYGAGKGAHLMLRRAEKARTLVSKIPAMVDALINKVTAWEKERGDDFIYDGLSLLSMLEDYTIMSQEKEQERKRKRDQKKLQEQQIAEQEAIFGSKSLSKSLSTKKTPKALTISPSQKTLGAATKTDLLSPKSAAKKVQVYKLSTDRMPSFAYF